MSDVSTRPMTQHELVKALIALPEALRLKLTLELGLAGPGARSRLSPDERGKALFRQAQGKGEEMVKKLMAAVEGLRPEEKR